MELNDREKTIVSLINQLSEVANDETSTQAAIDNIIGQIKRNTTENIKEEMKKAEQPMLRPRPEFPNIDVSNGIQSKIVGEQMKMLDEISRGNLRPENHVAQGQLTFTRIREVKAPTKAHPTDAGIDFFVPDAKAWTDEYKSMVRTYSKNPNHQDLVFIGVNGVEVAPGAHVAIPSGIKTIIPQGYGMMMVNKSGVATKLKLDHSACLIDSEYRDELIFCFFNHNVEPVKIEPGMKITQGLIVPILNLPMVEVLNCVYDDLAKQGNRGGGFGSTGVK
jgi:deoxyuridine 5'-triphosphate nucleotidohydrolase